MIKAYAVLFIKPGTPSTIVGADIFGEPHPTTAGMHTVPLFDMVADTFSVAADLAGKQLAHSFYDWCGELKTDPHRGVYRDARRSVQP